MQLHIWNAAEVEEHLSGNAAIFRATYFGELVLTPDTLAEQHRGAVAPGCCLVAQGLSADADANATRDLNAEVLRAEPFVIAQADILEIGCGTGLNTVCLAERARLPGGASPRRDRCSPMR